MLLAPSDFFRGQVLSNLAFLVHNVLTILPDAWFALMQGAEGWQPRRSWQLPTELTI